MISGHRLLGTCPPIGLTVESEPDVGAVRRRAATAAGAQGFAQTHRNRVSRVAAEMATYLVKHGPGGRMLVRLVEWGDLRGVELVATDGPGTDSADRPRVDGHPSEEELGVVEQLSDLFDMYSTVGRGTVMMARLWGGMPTGPSDRRFLVGSMAEAIPGEVVSGDAWAVEQEGPRVVALVADGLGHGEKAEVASAAAVLAFRQHHREPVEDIVSHIHLALRETRGAAIGVAEVDPDVGRLRFCGIGNIYARLITAGRSTELVSQYGIAGYQAPRIKAYEAIWGDGTLMVMHTDGLSSRWDLGAYDDLQRHHPQLAAAMVMRDAARANDDALVLALRAADGPVRVSMRDEG